MSMTRTTPAEICRKLTDAGFPVVEAASLPIESEPTSETADVPVPDAFSIVDEYTANWLVRKVLESRRYALDAEAWATAEARRARREESFLMQRYGPQLERWASDEVKKLNGRRKSVSLPAGTIGFRAEPLRLSVTDEAALLRWCHHHLPNALRLQLVAIGEDAIRLREWQERNLPEAGVAEQVVKAAVNAHMEHSGECPDGTEIVGGSNRLFVK